MSDGLHDFTLPSRGRGETPASTPRLLEPYGARVVLQPAQQELDAEMFLKALLEDVASACLVGGASVIGHLKCLVQAGDRRWFCNLTSTRSGAACRGEGDGRLSLQDGARLDLAVLVYGLPASTIDGLVGDALRSLLEPLGISWSKNMPSVVHASAGR
ncbi:MAG: hypothetical protein LLG45_12290 [Actinomycetia bacterium]|nr:hypothetical protein [Actinomycetes bacterium]